LTPQIEKDFHPGHISVIFKYLVAIHDNSTAFYQYLTKQGTEEAAQKAGVKLKSKHSIVPHVSLNDFFSSISYDFFLKCWGGSGSVLRLMDRQMDCLNSRPRTVGIGM